MWFKCQGENYLFESQRENNYRKKYSLHHSTLAQPEQQAIKDPVITIVKQIKKENQGSNLFKTSMN